MIEVESPQMQFGDIFINPKSRDDIPAPLKGLQLIYAHKRWLQQVF